MHFSDYVAQAKKTAIYPNHTEAAAVSYVTLGLVGEAGEIANKVKKVLRDDNGTITDAKREELQAELGDVLWYVAMLAHELRINLDSVAARNLHKLNRRKEEGVLGGSGDAR